MAEGLFAAQQYVTLQKTHGAELAAFLEKFGIAMPDFLAGDKGALGKEVNEAIVPKLCEQLHAKSLWEGCTHLLAIADIPVSMADTQARLFTRIAEHREDILAACKAKPPQPKKTASADETSRMTQHPQPAAGRTDGAEKSILQRPVVAAAGAAVVGGAIAVAAGASAGGVAAAGCVAGVVSGAAAHHLKQKAMEAGRKAKRFVQKSPSPTPTPKISPKQVFVWDNTRLDELKKTLDIITELSSLTAASYRS